MNETHPFAQLAAQMDRQWDVSTGNWFGLPCLKVDGKVFAARWQEDGAFKLAGTELARALEIPGARLFDPRGQGHPMKQWVQVPCAQASTWPHLAHQACAYVAGAAQARKEQLIAELTEARAQVLAAAEALPAVAWPETFLGEWSVMDLLAHLIGWDHTNLQAVQETLAGQRPSFWAHYDQDWRSYNAQLVATYRSNDPAELLAALRASHGALLAFLEATPADRLVKKSSIATLLKAETSDEQAHARQIDDFRQRWMAAHRGS